MALEGVERLLSNLKCTGALRRLQQCQGGATRFVWTLPFNSGLSLILRVGC